MHIDEYVVLGVCACTVPEFGFAQIGASSKLCRVGVGALRVVPSYDQNDYLLMP